VNSPNANAAIDRLTNTALSIKAERDALQQRVAALEELLRAAQPLLILAHSRAANAHDAEAVKIHGDTLDAITRALKP